MNIYKQVTGQGENVVLLHGWGCDHRYMQPIVDQLSSSYTVTNVDLPGRGQSDWQNHLANIHDMADLLLPHLPQQAIYVPWSFGGLITLSIASRYPERVKRIVGITTSPRFVEDIDWPGIPKPGFKPAFSAISTTEDLAQAFTFFYEAEFSNFKIKPSAYNQLIQLLETSPPNTLNVTNLLKGIDICDNTDLRNGYQSLHCPMDFIMGENDGAVSSATRTAMTSLNNNAIMHIIPGAQHMPFWTHPKEFNDILKKIMIS